MAHGSTQKLIKELEGTAFALRKFGVPPDEAVTPMAYLLEQAAAELARRLRDEEVSSRG